MTNRSYYYDAYLTEFESTVEAIVPHGDGQAIVLTESCFYPTSGGQAFDTGVLSISAAADPAAADPTTADNSQNDEKHCQSGWRVNIIDVVADSGGPILHIPDADVSHLAPGMSIHGKIEWERRYDHMQQHSSQHLLSHALDTLFGYETVSVHFGALDSTIDVRSPSKVASEPVDGTTDETAGETASETTGERKGKSVLLSAEQLVQVEQYVNDVIYQNIPIKAYFVNDAELPKLPLRRPPKVTGEIRIVEITELDYSACGGTHCRQTGELGPIKLVKQERQKGNVRLTFVSGHRGLQDYDKKHGIASEIAGIFNNEVSQTPALTRSLLEQNKALEKRLGTVIQQLLVYRAEELWQSAEHIGPYRMVAKLFDASEMANGLQIDDAKQLVSLLQQHSDAVILIVLPTGDKLTAIFAKGEGPMIHMGNILRATLKGFGGGGGGREDFAQGGGVPAATAPAVLAAAVAQVQSSAASM